MKNQLPPSISDLTSIFGSLSQKKKPAIFTLRVSFYGASNQIRTGERILCRGNIAVNSNSDAKPLDEMKINIGMNSVFEIILISLLLASFAGIVSISKITKYEPIKILMERN